jgi:hypothetical protein
MDQLVVNLTFFKRVLSHIYLRNKYSEDEEVFPTCTIECRLMAQTPSATQ